MPPGGDERDRAMFAKVKDHLIRAEDEVICKTCGKRFELPSHQSIVALDQYEGLPKEDYDE